MPKTASPATPESLPRRQTDPVWIQDHFLSTGHDKDTRSATVTLIKRRGRHYAVTCRHVLEAARNPDMSPGANNPTLALQIDRTVLNFSYFTARGPHLHVLTPVLGPGELAVDVAIAPLDGAYWTLLESRKNKSPIDLDAWHEPDWSSITYCLAAGYPDESKMDITTNEGEKVASQFTVVCAESTGKLASTERLITLSSELDKPHGFFFSGMSGGVIYGVEGPDPRVVEDDVLMPIGIIFEGYPASGRADASMRQESAFLTDRDLFFRGLTLTPEFFDEWMLKAGV